MEDFAEARHPPFDPHAEESDTDSDVTGAKELSPRYPQPVWVGADPLEVEAEESMEDEEAVEELDRCLDVGIAAGLVAEATKDLGGHEQVERPGQFREMREPLDRVIKPTKMLEWT